MRILGIPRKYFAPGAAAAVYLQVMRHVQLRRADQSVDEFIVEFGLLQKQAESKMGMGTGLRGQFASI